MIITARDMSLAVRAALVEHETRHEDSILDREQAPAAGNAFQAVGAAVAKRQVRADDEILDRARDQHFVRPGQRADARRDVQRDAGKAVTDSLHFAGVETGTDLEAEGAHRLADRLSATHGMSRSLKAGKQAVPCRIELAAAVVSEVRADELIVGGKELVPEAI